MVIHSNPYIAGNPVHGQDRFIGRADVLREVSRTLHNPSTNAIVLFGQRRIGKTSILLHLESELTAEKEYIPVYFDLQDKASLPLGEVLFQIAQKISLVTGISGPDQKDFGQEGNFFRDKFIPKIVQRNSNKGIVLLFDEFDVLDNRQLEQAGASFFPYLREWMRITEGVQFVFVLGRRPEELSTNTMSAFKAIGSRQVSLMKKEDSNIIIYQSEKNGTLKWSDEATERVWHWTQGHPYLTQLLCSEIWETCIDTKLEKSQDVKPDQVDAVIDKALEQGANAFQWIWNGLPSAERMVIAAMAEAKRENISHEELTDILNRSNVRLILRELELAPETLIRWDLVREVNNGFHFALPLLRRWVASEKPLRRVKAELDSVEPLAESLYTSGDGYYKIGKLDEAEQLLRNALNVNPNHLRARLLLGQVLIGMGTPAKAVSELESAYEFDPGSAKSGLIGALLALTGTQKEKDQLETYARILEIDPKQPMALAILLGQAEAALKKDDLTTALKLYEQAGNQKGISHVQRTLRKREMEDQLAVVRKYENAEDWSSAIDSYELLKSKFPDERDWDIQLKTARVQSKLAETYVQAHDALQKGDKKLAQKLFGEVIGIEPSYKNALRHFLLAVKNVDIDVLLQQHREDADRLEKLQTQQQMSEKKIIHLHKALKKQSIFSVWNLLIYICFMLCVLIIPSQFDHYLRRLDENEEALFKRQASWFISTLIWLPIFLWISCSLISISTTFTLIIQIIVGLSWLVTGIFGKYYDHSPKIISIITAIMTSCIVIITVTMDIVSIIWIYNLLYIVLLIFAGNTGVILYDDDKSVSSLVAASSASGVGGAMTGIIVLNWMNGIDSILGIAISSITAEAIGAVISFVAGFGLCFIIYLIIIWIYSSTYYRA